MPLRKRVQKVSVKLSAPAREVARSETQKEPSLPTRKKYASNAVIPDSEEEDELSDVSPDTEKKYAQDAVIPDSEEEDELSEPQEESLTLNEDTMKSTRPKRTRTSTKRFGKWADDDELEHKSPQPKRQRALIEDDDVGFLESDRPLHLEARVENDEGGFDFDDSSDYDSDLEDEFDFDSTGYDDDDSLDYDSDLEDEEVLLGPEDDEGNRGMVDVDSVDPSTDIYTALDSPSSSQNLDLLTDARIILFRQRLNMVIDAFKNEAKIPWATFASVPREERIICKSFYLMLSRVGTDFLLDKYCQAIPVELQKICGQETWANEEVVDALPINKWRGNNHQGIYCAFVRKDDQPYEPYVGGAYSKGGLHRRISEHISISSRKSQSDKSAFYRYLGKHGMKPNFRVLAEFDNISSGYLALLESIFMVFFGSYQYPGFVYLFSTQRSYNWVNEVRKRANIGNSIESIQGLNRALPSLQGFIDPRSKGRKTFCCNCKRECFSSSVGKLRRYLVNSDDPLGSYMCSNCCKFVTGKVSKPKNSAGVTAHEAAKKRIAQMDDPPCENPGCSYTKSSTHKLSFVYKFHEYWCSACRLFFSRNKKRKTSFEQLKATLTSPDRIAAVARLEAQADPSDPVCENPSCTNKKSEVFDFRFCLGLKLFVCTGCKAYWRRHKKLRPKAESMPEICGSPECTCLKSQSSLVFRWVGEAELWLCGPCQQYWYLNKKLRTKGKWIKFKDTVCENPVCSCLKSKSRITFTTGAGLALCEACRGYWNTYKRLRTEGKHINNQES